jgi:hypothetical protein
MAFAWWWEPRNFARAIRSGRFKSISSFTSPAFRTTPVEEVRSAIRQGEQRLRQISKKIAHEES